MIDLRKLAAEADETERVSQENFARLIESFPNVHPDSIAENERLVFEARSIRDKINAVFRQAALIGPT